MGAAGASGFSVLHPSAAVEGSAFDGGTLWASTGDSGGHAADGRGRGHAVADPSASQVCSLRVSSFLQRRVVSAGNASQIGPLGEQKGICETVHGGRPNLERGKE